MLRQLLLTHFFTDCLSIQFLVYPPPHPHPLFPPQLVRPSLVTYFSLCSTCVTYGTPCHIIGHQPLPTQPCYRKYYFYSQVFLPCTPSCSSLPWGRQFSLKASKASSWSSNHCPGSTICLNHSNPQKI